MRTMLDSIRSDAIYLKFTQILQRAVHFLIGSIVDNHGIDIIMISNELRRTFCAFTNGG